MDTIQNNDVNGCPGNHESLTRQIAALKGELAELRKERDFLLNVVYGFLEKESLAKRDEDERALEEFWKKAAGQPLEKLPSMEELIASLK